MTNGTSVGKASGFAAASASGLAQDTGDGGGGGLQGLLRRGKPAASADADQIPEEDRAEFLDEQQQEDLIAKFQQENASIDHSLKMAMLMLATPVSVVLAMQSWVFFKGSPTIEVVNVAYTMHAFPTMATMALSALFIGLVVLLIKSLLRGPTSDVGRYTRLFRALQVGAAVATINFALYLAFPKKFDIGTTGLPTRPEPDASTKRWEHAFWAIPALILGGFAYAIREMRKVDQSVAHLATLKYKLKGA